MEDSAYCSCCGAENAAGVELCSSCGATVTRATAGTAGPHGPAQGSRREVNWRWVTLGFVAISGLHALIVFGLFELFPLEDVWPKLAIGAVPYLVGGLVIGARLGGEAVLEPFYASAVPAVIFPFVMEVQRILSMDIHDVAQVMGRLGWVAALGPVLVYVLLTLFGSWLAARIRAAA